ncbi:MAG: acetyl-CoA hydrolase/transferase C-terminal domain-containing protein [Gammaproteobacteria bacterium]
MLNDADPPALNPAACADFIIERLGPELVVGTPLGLGKANCLLNELYRRASKDGSIKLTIITALTLEVPSARSDLERRFLEPLNERLFAGYPELDYATARRRGTLPDNVRVHEFFLAPGKWMGVASAQQDYISSNYTHVARDMLDRGVNLIVQMVSPGGDPDMGEFSLSCNSDVTLDLLPAMRHTNPNAMIVGEINDQLPFMHGDAQVERRYFDALCEVPGGGYTLFGPPKTPVSDADHAIGLHVSTLVRDGGTLQVGIGSMGDAVVNALVLRERDNALYQDVMAGRTDDALVAQVGGLERFEQGLYGATEMLVDGFVDLFDHGVLKRRVYDDLTVQLLVNDGFLRGEPTLEDLDALISCGAVKKLPDVHDVSYLQHWGIFDTAMRVENDRLVWADGATEAADFSHPDTRARLAREGFGEGLRHGAVAHGGFFLGPAAFYQRLRDLSDTERDVLQMTSVGRINQLYGGEPLDRAQRGDARFINSCLMATLNGAVVSDGLEDGRVISGVGGQYNFVSMAHALPGARSILKARATRSSGGKVTSNILFSYGHCTIPRHLRDIVVTEYGVANLRGRTDAECADALIRIADSRFQAQLIQAAQSGGKLPADYALPDHARHNTPQALRTWLGDERWAAAFGRFPFGKDLTDDELELASALRKLKNATGTRRGKLRTAWRALTVGSADERTQRLLKRLDLDAPTTWREKLSARAVAQALD